MTYPGGYPLVLDRDAYTRSLLPDVAATGDGAALSGVLTSPLYDLDDAAAAIYAGVYDLADASAEVLDMIGAWYREPRTRLDDHEYRRILAGRQALDGGGISLRRIRQIWIALTGSDEATVERPGLWSLRLGASVGWHPGGQWLARAGAVLHDSVEPGAQVTASVSPSGTARWGDPVYGWGVGAWAHQLRVEAS